MKSEPLVIQRQINAPADRVWKALTDPTQLEKWFFKFENFRPEPGFEFIIPDDYPSSCKIIEAVKNKRLSYSLSFNQYPSETIVTFELFDEGETTRLRLSHEGLENIPAAGNADFEKEKFMKGWGKGLSSLQHYLEVLIYC
jgi:uncharacterized protein YndB with AHSA1/START domain